MKCGSALACLGIICSVNAKAEQEIDFANLSLETLVNLKVKIASRNETPLWQNPSSVSLITQDDIERLGLRTLIDVFSQVPGFYSMMDSTEGNLSHMVMRGHAQNYANTLLILLNGQRINDDYTGGINYFIRYFNIQDARKIEIIRGPGSALYGSNAYSGVINIITDTREQLTAELGSQGRLALSAGKHISIADWQLGSSVSLYHDDGDTFTKAFDRENLQHSTQDPHEVTQVSFYANNQRSKLNGQYLHSNRQDFYLFRRLRDGVTELDLKHWMIYGSHQLVNQGAWTVDVSAGYQNAKRNSISALVAKGQAPYDDADFLFGLDFNYQSSNLALDATYQIGQNSILNFGSSIVTSDIPRSYLKSNYDIFGDEHYLDKVVTFSSDPAFRTVIDKTRRIRSGYLQYQWNASPVLSFTTGIRYDSYNDIDNALTPRLSMVHQLDEHQGYKIIYGQAYRAPSLGDLYDEESGLTVGNRTLAANEVTSREAVYYWRNDDTALTATWFDNHHTNIVAPYNDGNLSYLANIGSNRARGLELEWHWQPLAQWQIKSALTHLFKHTTSILPEAGLTPSEEIAPRSYLNYDIQYLSEYWSVNVSGTWRDKVNALADNSSLLLVNANLRYFWSDKMTWQLALKNITDKRYFTSTYSPLGTESDGEVVQQLPARGLQAVLALSYQW